MLQVQVEFPRLKGVPVLALAARLGLWQFVAVFRQMATGELFNCQGEMEWEQIERVVQLLLRQAMPLGLLLLVELSQSPLDVVLRQPERVERLQSLLAWVEQPPEQEVM